MKHGICALALIMIATSVTAHPVKKEQPPSADTSVEQKVTRSCPTKHVVQPYIWLDPKTGMEYRALRLHCPAHDDA